MTRPGADRTSGFLARVPLFSTLSPADMEAISRVAKTRAIRPREALFHKGEEGSQLYVVASGRLKVVTSSEEGDDLIFCIVGPGDVIGEVGLLSARCRTATVIAMEASELIVIDRRDFLPLLRSRPEVAVELLAVLSERLAHVSELLEDMQFLNLPVRLAKKLADIGNQHGVLRKGEAGDELFIDCRLSQEEWGDLVGATRESINKQFGVWTRDGFIRMERGRVVVTDVDALERLAECVVI